MLTFATDRDRALATHLMQPCLIRIIDNLRKATETLDWQSEYVQQMLWPDGTTADQQQQVATLAAELDHAAPEDAPRLEQALTQLPTPTPAYQLCLTRDGRTAALDVWELCFHVCFDHYHPDHPVTVDPSLIDPEGEIDWITLDEKAKALVTESLARVTGE
jgi:hypothetical protein